MRRLDLGLLLLMAAVSGVISPAYAVNWDAGYEGDVLPNASTPVWSHGLAGGSSTVADGGLTITNYNGSAYAANSWDIDNNPYMAGPKVAFQFNDPDVPGEIWTTHGNSAFTIEWRMKINADAATVPSDQIGVKLQAGGYLTNQAYYEWYYDGPNTRLANRQWAWGAHAGKTGPEGAETDFSNDGFANIGVGEWHVYRLTSAKISSTRWHRELWLDGNYVGRWWDEKSVGAPQIKMRTNNSRALLSSITFDYVRWADEPEGRFVRPVPLAPQTLLLNQSFETLAGASQGWYGYYSDNLALVPNPPVMDGGGRFGIGRGEPGAASTATWQTVPINAGETVTFDGYLHSAIQGNATSSATVTLYDSSEVGGTVIGSVTVDPTTPTTDGSWVKVTVSGAANSGFVTVALTTELSPASWTDVAAVHADGFTLTTSGPCTAQHALSSIVPVSNPHNTNVTGAVLSGTNLDQVTAVKLVQIPSGSNPPVIIPGTVTSVTPGALTIDFATAGTALGKYNVVAEAPSCTTQQLVNGFEVFCANPTTVTGLSPNLLTPAQGVVYFTISGTNVHALTGAKLVLESTELVGFNMAPSGDDLSVHFDLAGAPEGFYNLVTERSDSCFDPAPLAAALRYLPSGSGNQLVNGDFETGTLSPWVGGCLTNSMSFAGIGPHSGSWFLGAANNGGATDCSSQQSIGLPNGPGEYDLTAIVWAWLWDDGINDPGYESYVRAEIIVDGESKSVTTVSTRTHPMQTYVPMAVRWTGTANSDISVKLTLRGDGRGGWGVVGADDIELNLSGRQCNNPFADADGDGDVDHTDFAVLQSCITGSMGGQIPDEPEYCWCFDRPESDPPAKDGDIDQADVQQFEACASGPGIPADATCDGAP